MSQSPEPFELLIPVEAADIDQMGHVNNVIYLRWVQDVAAAHWQSAAPPADQEKVMWIVLRHEIDYRHPALPGDTIAARTWVGSATRIRYERHTEILRSADRTLLAKARTMWCPIDAHTGKPAVLGPELRARFSVG